MNEIAQELITKAKANKAFYWSKLYTNAFQIHAESREKTRFTINACVLLSVQNAADVCKLFKSNKREIEQVMNWPEYNHFAIRKKKGGMRDIYEPSPELKNVQRYLNYFLQNYFALIKLPGIHGFTIKQDKYNHRCNILSNAQPHVKKKFVLNIDLKDFFPSITAARVKKLFMSAYFQYSEEIATALALLSTYEGKLNTGSPCSPIISNFICIELDQQLIEFCAAHNITYTRYADDLSFSSNDNISNDILLDIISIINSEQFKINEQKLRMRPNYRRQVVTGITVNEKPNVDRKMLKKIRAMLHDIRRNGIAQAVSNHYKVYGWSAQFGQQKFLNKLVGYIGFVGQVRGVYDHYHLNFLREFKELEALYFPEYNYNARNRFYEQVNNIMF
jgi:RNA-directed DNA polymerase